MLLSEICGLVSVGRPLWREEGSAICSVITQWSESRRTRNHTCKSKFEVTLRLTVSQSVCLGIEHPCGTCNQILLTVRRLLSESSHHLSVGRPLWREDAVCSAITQWSESHRTRKHTLAFYLRLHQPGGLGSRIYKKTKLFYLNQNC
jgi:hypothetical protein